MSYYNKNFGYVEESSGTTYTSASPFINVSGSTIGTNYIHSNFATNYLSIGENIPDITYNNCYLFGETFLTGPASSTANVVAIGDYTNISGGDLVVVGVNNTLDNFSYGHSIVGNQNDCFSFNRSTILGTGLNVYANQQMVLGTHLEEHIRSTVGVGMDIFEGVSSTLPVRLGSLEINKTLLTDKVSTNLKILAVDDSNNRVGYTTVSASNQLLEKNITMGSATAGDQLVKIVSNQKVDVWIASDADNIDENDLPTLTLSTDNVSSALTMGIDYFNNGYIASDSTSGGSLRLMTGGAPAGSPPKISNWSSQPTIAIDIDQSQNVSIPNGMLTVSNYGIKFGTFGSTLDVYTNHEITGQFNVNGGVFSNLDSIPISVCTIGKTITLHTNTTSIVKTGTQTGSPANFYNIGPIGSAYRPKQEISFPIRIINDGVADFGLAVFQTNGNIMIYRDASTTTTWSLGLNSIYNFSVSYCIA